MRQPTEFEEKYHKIFDSIDEGFCIFEMLYDATGKPVDYRFLEVNPAFQKHTGLVDAEGRTILEMVPDHEKYWFEIYDEIAETGQPVRMERRGEGMHRWFSVNAFRLGGPGSKKVAAIFTDITQRRQLEEALMMANRRKDEFLATLAHELRNPLAPLRNGMYLMKTAGDDRQLMAQCLTIMDRQLNHMVHLIDDLMDISRISRGKIRLRRKRIEVAAVVQSAVEATDSLVQANAHTLTVNVPSQPIFIDADAMRMAQVIGNLLTNAAKYTNNGGRINLDVQCESNQVVILVKDNGVGMSPSILMDVFEIFTQGDGITELPQNGLGIGLALVKNLVEMHGGTVAATSEGADLGSEFTVRLPMLSD